MLNVFEIFSYSFMLKALIVGLLISICASLIGTFLVLKRNSMIGDGLSHVAFGAFAVATVLGFAPIVVAIPVVIIVSFFILKLNDNNKVHGDSAVALMSASSLAIGTFLISVIKGVNVDINSYLFGSILSINSEDVILSVIIFLVVIVLFLTSYNKIFSITFDERFAKSIGINTDLYNAIFAILCSVIIVLGMRLMGALLISSLIIFPSISSMQIFKNFKSVVISSVVISVISFVVGLIASYYFEVPTGSTIVITNLLILIVFKIIMEVRRKRKWI